MNKRLARLFAQLYREQANDGTGEGGAAGGGASGAGTGAADSGSAGSAAGGSGASGDSGAGGGAGSGAGADATKSILAELGAGTAGAGAAGAGQGQQGQAGELTSEQKALQAAEKDTRRPQHVPAKYWDSEKGEVRAEAAFKSLGELETRMRSTGLPPKSADEYKFEVPAPLKEAGIDLDKTTSDAFRGAAHELGLTQKQYEGVMGRYFEHMQTLAVGASNYGREKLNTELRSYYKTDEALKENVQLAFAVVNAYGDDEEKEAAMGPMGNTPPWVYRLLAKVGKELKEDVAVVPDQALGGDTIEHLMRGAEGNEDSPYWNPSDPRHAETVRKVTAYHAAAAKAGQRRRGE